MWCAGVLVRLARGLPGRVGRGGVRGHDPRAARRPGPLRPAAPRVPRARAGLRQPHALRAAAPAVRRERRLRRQRRRGRPMW